MSAIDTKKGYVEIINDQLCFKFPEMGAECALRVTFHRTLRLPDDNKSYGLPPSLGAFELTHIDDHKEGLPAAWSERGGVLFPMWQAEAMWLSFDSPSGWPFAIKIATGKVNALTGESWENELSAKSEKQDYMVSPGQPWLDGFCVAEGKVRQFVAMPQGSGYTAEEQITGKAEHGGLQIIVYPMKAEARAKLAPPRRPGRGSMGALASACSLSMDDSGGGLESMGASAKGGVLRSSSVKRAAPAKEMGLAAGGLMEQEIYADPYDREVWDSAFARCFVHLVDAVDYEAVLGKKPRHASPTAADYARQGLPWFNYSDTSLTAIKGSSKLANLDSVAAMGVKKNETPLPENESIKAPKPVELSKPKKPGIRDGSW